MGAPPLAGGSSRLAAMAGAAFCLLFPSRCQICNVALGHAGRLPVCADCLNRLQPITAGHAGPEGDGEEARGAAAEAGALASLESWAWYEGACRELIHLLKFHHLLPVADFLASRMEQLPVPAAADLVLAVPLARRRRQERGFNQAERIARLWARRHRLRTRFGALWRTRETAPQWGLTAEARRANVTGAFAAEPSAVAGRRIVLFDDVVTTGATVSACAEALRRAGAMAVHARSAARTPRREVEGHLGGGIRA